MVVSILPNAVFAPIVYKGNLENNIIKLKNIGYNGIEIGGIRNPKDINISKVKKLLDKTNMSVVTLGTAQPYFDDGISFSDPDKNIRNEAVNRIKDIIKLAGDLNANIMLSLIFGRVIIDSKNNQSKKIEIARKRISECVAECLDYSEKYSTNFLIEPLNRYETNIFNKLEEVNIFIEKYKNKFNGNRIGLLADTFHMNIEETNIHKSFEKFNKIIKHIHFSDSNRCAPGCGHIDFNIICKVLKENNYNDFISFEILPYPDPDAAAKNGLNFIKSILN